MFTYVDQLPEMSYTFTANSYTMSQFKQISDLSQNNEIFHVDSIMIIYAFLQLTTSSLTLTFQK